MNVVESLQVAREAVLEQQRAFNDRLEKILGEIDSAILLLGKPLAAPLVHTIGTHDPSAAQVAARVGAEVSGAPVPVPSTGGPEKPEAPDMPYTIKPLGLPAERIAKRILAEGAARQGAAMLSDPLAIAQAMRAKGSSWSVIAEHLNARGIKPKLALVWTMANVSKLVTLAEHKARSAKQGEPSEKLAPGRPKGDDSEPIKIALSLMGQGLSIRETIDELNKRGMTTSTGMRWGYWNFRDRLNYWRKHGGGTEKASEPTPEPKAAEEPPAPVLVRPPRAPITTVKRVCSVCRAPYQGAPEVQPPFRCELCSSPEDIPETHAFEDTPFNVGTMNAPETGQPKV